MNFDWLKTLFGTKRTYAIGGRAVDNYLSLKQIVDNAIDDFINKEPDGSLEKTHGMIYVLFRVFANEEETSDEPLLIDHQTTILGIPADRSRVLKYKERLDKEPPTGSLYESVHYIHDLNMITYIGGGTHRLAALNLYYRDQKPPFAMSGNKIVRCSINTEKLKRYNIYEKEKTLYYIDETDPLEYTYRTELTPLMFDLIVNLQVHYFGQANLIDKKREREFYKAWQSREKNPIERAQELFGKHRRMK